MRRLELVLAACATLAMTAACGGGGDGGGAGGSGAGFQSSIQGSWTTDCQAIGSNSMVSTAVVSGLNYTLSLMTWNNTTCAGTGTSFGPFPSTYVVGAAVTAPLGATPVTAYQVDITDSSGTSYDLLHLDRTTTPNRLYFGDTSGANDASTPALRPTALDTIIYLHR